MAYVLGPVIGEIGGPGAGGTEIDVIPVDAAASGGAGSSVVLHAIDVQPGKFVLASFFGNVSASNIADNQPSLTIGPATTGRNFGQTGIAALLTEPATFQIIRETSTGTDHVAGILFLTRLDPEALQ